MVLNCNLIIEEEKLLATVDELRGSVRYYSFEVGRHLINDGAQGPSTALISLLSKGRNMS